MNSGLEFLLFLSLTQQIYARHICQIRAGSGLIYNVHNTAKLIMENYTSGVNDSTEFLRIRLGSIDGNQAAISEDSSLGNHYVAKIVSVQGCEIGMYGFSEASNTHCL